MTAELYLINNRLYKAKVYLNNKLIGIRESIHLNTVLQYLNRKQFKVVEFTILNLN